MLNRLTKLTISLKMFIFGITAAIIPRLSGRKSSAILDESFRKAFVVCHAELSHYALFFF